MSAKNNKEKVFDKVFNELYKLKDNYGVDQQTEFFNSITKLIKRGSSNEKGPSSLNIQKADWSAKTNLAIYKEGLGITPIGSLNNLETSEGKRIPLENFNADFYEYYFIMTKNNPTNPRSGTAGQDKFKLVERDNKYFLEIGKEDKDGDKPSGDDDIKKEKLEAQKKLIEAKMEIEKKIKEKRKILIDDKKLASKDSTTIASSQLLITNLEARNKELKEEINKLKKNDKDEKEKTTKNETIVENDKQIIDLKSHIDILKKIEKDVDLQMKDEENIIKLESEIKQLDSMQIGESKKKRSKYTKSDLEIRGSELINLKRKMENMKEYNQNTLYF